ncbi:MAG: zinc ribbon domain-containing protein [Ardenticatenaceae bacterium]
MSGTHTHICPGCDKQQEKGDGFCDDCGTQLVATRYCNDCGVMAPARSKFCRQCGAKLPPISTASIPAAPAPAPSPPTKRPQPKWLSKAEPTPPPAKPKASPKPTSGPKAPTSGSKAPSPKAAPLVKAQPAQPAPPAPAPAPAPLAPRPTAAPVPMRAAPLAPTSGTGNTAAVLVASMAGIMAVSALMLNNIVLALMLFVVMTVVGGYRLRYYAANGIDKVIDWAWEDPVLRRRFFGE